MRTDAALWCTEKARLARKWIVRYGRTYRFLAVPKRENLKADFKKVRLLGVPPFLFLGFNYTAFSYFYSLVERYEFREVQFSSIGLDALLTASIGPINLQYALLDLLYLASLAAIFYLLSGALIGKRTRSLRFFFYAGCYAFGAVWPLIIIIAAVLRAVAVYDEASSTISLPAFFLSSKGADAAVLSPTLMAAQWGFHYKVYENLVEVFIDFRVLVMVYIVAYGRPVVIFAVATVGSLLVNVLIAPIGESLNRFSEYALDGDGMIPNFDRGQILRVNHHYRDNILVPHHSSSGSSAVEAVVTLDECRDYKPLFGQEAGQSLQSSSVFFDGQRRDISPMVFAECPLRSWMGEKTGGDLKALMRFVAFPFSKVEIFGNGKILIDGKPFGERFSAVVFTVQGEGKWPEVFTMVTWAFSKVRETRYDTREEALYYWPCYKCEDNKIFEYEVPKDKLVVMFDSPFGKLPRFLVVDKERTNAKAFFQVRKRW